MSASNVVKKAKGTVTTKGGADIADMFQHNKDSKVMLDTQRRVGVMRYLINSFIEGLPIGIIYTLMKDGVHYILDGNNRGHTLSQFINKDATIDGFKFSDLSESDRRKLLTRQVPVHVLDYAEFGSMDSVVEYFERINKGTNRLSQGPVWRIEFYTSKVYRWMDAKDKAVLSKIQRVFSKYKLFPESIDRGMRDEVLLASVCAMVESGDYVAPIAIKSYVNKAKPIDIDLLCARLDSLLGLVKPTIVGNAPTRMFQPAGYVLLALLASLSDKQFESRRKDMADLLGIYFTHTLKELANMFDLEDSSGGKFQEGFSRLVWKKFSKGVTL